MCGAICHIHTNKDYSSGKNAKENAFEKKKIITKKAPLEQQDPSWYQQAITGSTWAPENIPCRHVVHHGFVSCLKFSDQGKSTS